MISENSQRPALDHDQAVAQGRRALEGVVGIPATGGNRVTVLRNGNEIFPAMLEAIDGAEHFEKDLERSVKIDARRWKERSLLQHAKVRLVAPLRRVS